MRSTAPRSRPAARTTARRACARNIIRTTTARSCSIPTATTSRRSATRRVSASLTAHVPALTQAGGRQPGRRAVTLDAVHDLAMLAVLALHVDRDDGVRRRHQEQHRKHQAEQDARHDQHEVEHRRERLPVEQQRQRRHEKRQDVDHRQTSQHNRLLCRKLRSATVEPVRRSSATFSRNRRRSELVSCRPAGTRELNIGHAARAKTARSTRLRSDLIAPQHERLLSLRFTNSPLDCACDAGAAAFAAYE